MHWKPKTGYGRRPPAWQADIQPGGQGRQRMALIFMRKPASILESAKEPAEEMEEELGFYRYF